jgi:hypothetical protein
MCDRKTRKDIRDMTYEEYVDSFEKIATAKKSVVLFEGDQAEQDGAK